jgi:hypothetical protein
MTRTVIVTLVARATALTSSQPPPLLMALSTLVMITTRRRLDWQAAMQLAVVAAT